MIDGSFDWALAGQVTTSFILISVLGLIGWDFWKELRIERQGARTVEQEQDDTREMASHAPSWPMGNLHGE